MNDARPPPRIGQQKKYATHIRTFSKGRLKKMDLKERCKKFLMASGVPITRMCFRLNMAASSYYRWQQGLLKLSDSRLEAIDQYLRQFGF